MPAKDESRLDQLDQAKAQLHIIKAVVRAAEQPHRLLDVVLAATDADDAAARIRAEFGFSEAQAIAVLDAQFRRMSQRDRERMIQMVEDIQAGIDELSQ